MSVGNINGNVTIKGSLAERAHRLPGLDPRHADDRRRSIDSQSAVVSGGSIGNKNKLGRLSAVNGILAAVGPINVIKIGSTNKAVYFKQTTRRTRP